MARHRDRLSDLLRAGRIALSHPARSVPAPFADVADVPQQCRQTALPVRTWGAFMLGNGVGGAGVHWNAETWRFLPTDFTLKTHLTQRYGANFLPDDMTIQDWGVTYDELEPHYDQFEYLCGTSGPGRQSQGHRSRRAAIRSRARARGPIRRRRRSSRSATRCSPKPRKQLGYKPFPQPSGNLSQAYTNPLGVKLGQCTYCGFCEWFGCANYSKATPQTTILPVLVRKPNFEARTDCEVTRINLDSTGKRATGVTFVDTSGEEWEQPADLVLLCAFQLFNVQLLLLSGIGTPYDPQTGQGQIGRNFTHQTVSTAIGFFDKDKYNFNPFIASGSIGMCIDEFNGDNFDHGPLGFVGGGYIGQVQTNGRPIETTAVPPGTPAWGSKWKQALSDNYLSTIYSRRRLHASFYSYRDNLSRPRSDLQGPLRPAAAAHDHGFPRQRTQDERVSHRQICRDHASRWARSRSSSSRARALTTSPPYQTSHLCGGAIMGDNPGNSALNSYLQSWDVPNLFVQGASAFPQNAGYNPTGTVGALAYLVRRRDPLAISQKPGAARPCVRTTISFASCRARCCSAPRLRCAGCRASPPAHRQAGFQPDRARPLSRHRRRLRRLPYAARQRPRFRRRPADRDAVRHAARAEHHARSADRHRRLDRRRIRQCADQGHRPQRRASLSGDALHLLHQDDARRRARDPRLSQHRSGRAQSGESRSAAVSVRCARQHGGSGTSCTSSRAQFSPRGQERGWNRGAYLVEGLGHCGLCHTPKNLLGGDKTARSAAGLCAAGLVRARHHQ